MQCFWWILSFLKILSTWWIWWLWQSVQYGESESDSESRVSDESGHPGEIGDYDESRHFRKSGDSWLYGESCDPSEFGDYDKLGKTGDVYEYCDFMNIMILVIQVYLFIMVNVAKLVILVFLLNIEILTIQVNLVNSAIFWLGRNWWVSLNGWFLVNLVNQQFWWICWFWWN